MESYLLFLFVTLEQEDAIKLLFHQNGWVFKRGDQATLTMKQEPPGYRDELKTRTPMLREKIEADNQSDEESVVEPADCDSDTTIISLHCASQESNDRLPFENKLARLSQSGKVANEFVSSNKYNNHLFDGSSRKDSSTEHSESGEDLNNIVLDKETEALAKTLISNENVDSWFNNALGFNKEDSEEEISDVESVNDLVNQSDSSETDEQTIQPDDIQQGKDRSNYNSSSREAIKLKIEKGKQAFRQKRRRKRERENERELNEEENTDTVNKRNRITVNGKRPGKKRPIHCVDCKITFTSQKRYDSHKEKNDGKCVFECEYCGKIFLYRKSKYLLHIRSAHTKERPFVCETCGKGYVTSDKLKIHKRIHTGEKPCICEECGRRFYSRAELSIHKDYHHVSKECQEDFWCKECNITFCSKRYLIYHKTVTHSTRRDFLCNKCDKTFKCNSALQRHLKHIHSESRKYKCEICEKSFKTNACLKKHTVRHGGEKLYFCDECNKGFYEKAKLLQHLRIHTGEKPYKCDLCDYRCALSGNLSKHRKTHTRQFS